ncbi:MAG: Competence protein ComM [Chroococcopsis gigantea SAG 12.99]|jgi:magnesium chelatase family protein|nr:Competence protein ComM [Chroococcopsis gigantea SAG 12.99]
MLARVWSASILGIDAIKVGVEVDVSGGLPGIALVGLPDAAVQESRERVKAAIKNTGLAFPMRKVVVNLAPADVKKEGPSFDLPISIGILAGSEQVETRLLAQYLFLGELSLDGSLRPVAGVLPIAASALQMGMKGLVVPIDNSKEAAVVKGIQVYGFKHLSEVVKFLNGTGKFTPVEYEDNQEDDQSFSSPLDLKDVKGQHHARRALEIAAAGGHNLIFVGPPGSGKTLLARRLAGIMPPLSFKEALEVSQIHSVAGLLKNRGSLIQDRPFRSPHHSASGPALAGGGSIPRPGEISLAHRGVLFLDELTEFKRNVLEYLRQPLEEGFVTISRTRQSITFPAQFTLIASTNPCPCGYYGDTVESCKCSPRTREQYWAKLSGPLLDRIDLQVSVGRLKPEEMTRYSEGESSGSVRARVIKARKIAQNRFQNSPGIWCNSQMGAAQLRSYCHLDNSSRTLLENAIKKLGLSARAMDRVLKVARTIADLQDTDNIGSNHIAEAIGYRTIARSS